MIAARGLIAMQERFNRPRAILRSVRMEIGTGRPGYRWVDGYEVIQPNGRPLAPYMRKREAKAFCKVQGWTAVVQS